MKKITKYKANDGKEFDTLENCEEYEKENAIGGKVEVTMYLHGDKESCADTYREEGVVFTNEEARRKAMFALYEVMFQVEVDTDTGDVVILSVDGVKL